MSKRFGRGGRSSGDGRDGRFGSPYDFSTADAADITERLDPVDMMAIRADEELLDLLAAGGQAGPRPGGGAVRPMAPGRGPSVPGPRTGMGADFNDDQQLFAMLASWRADVHSEPFPELVSVEEASEAIVAGQRAANRGRRRLMPVAAAATVVVLGMTGVWAGATNALPGDPLWGVSRVIDGNRAKSVEAQYRVTSALTAVEQALSEGRVSEARAKLAEVQPDLDKVRDQQQREKLSKRSQTLMDSTEDSREGERVDLDESGARRDRDRDRDRRESAESGRPGSESSDPSRDPSVLRESDPSRPSHEVPFPEQMPNPKPYPGNEGSRPFPMPNPNPFPGPEKPHPTTRPEEPRPYPIPGGEQIPTNPANPGVPFPGGNRPYPFPGPMPFPQQPAPKTTQQQPEQQQPGQQQPGQQHQDRTTRPAPSNRPNQENRQPSGGERTTRPNSEHSDRGQSDHPRREPGSDSGSGGNSNQREGERGDSRPENDSGSDRGQSGEERRGEPDSGNGGR